ncbi:MAG: hypothetical protein FWF84_01790, partial [Kiritimatiellaeota bacterium]|nr:hypothetical protein [Kiritimatiellota bacterium]
ADVVTRSEKGMNRLMPGARQSDRITWVSAAKPMGYVETAGGDTVAPMLAHNGMVVPAFREVRLIPVDTAHGGGLGAFDLAWRRHVDEHLPTYMRQGPDACPPDGSECRYCHLLTVWEESAFRTNGFDWLSSNSWMCTVSPPTGGRGGGSSYGH